MHPFPGRPQADARADHQQRCGKEHAGAKITVKPMAERETEQGWQHDRPAENADLAETDAKGGLGLLPCCAFAQQGSLGRASDAVG